MKKTFLTFAAALGLTAAAAGPAAFGAAPASARPSAPAPVAADATVYDGRTLTQDNLAISNWGGGSVEDNTGLFLIGGHSLKVTTLDPYQGAKIDLQTPAALSGHDKMFQVIVQRGDVTLHYDPQAFPGAQQTDPAQNGGFGGGRGRGGRGGGGFGGGGFGGGGFGGGGFGGRGRRGGYGERGGGAPAPLIPLISKLRLEFTLTDGRKADILEPIPTTADISAGAGWYAVNVPLTALKFGGSGDPLLKSVTVAGNQFGVFYIGRMQIAPLTAAPVEIENPTPADDTDANPDDGVPPDEQQPGAPGEQPGPPDGRDDGRGDDQRGPVDGRGG